MNGVASLVMGVAGSGKTTLLRERFLALASAGTPVERIAVVVPSAARAGALRSALEDALPGGYEELAVFEPVGLACRLLGVTADELLAPGDRLAMLLERVDELPLEHHDIGGSLGALVGGFIARVDALKAELVSAEDFAAWAASRSGPGADAEREFAAAYSLHERLLAEAAARDAGDAVSAALRAVPGRSRFEFVLADDVHGLSTAAARLVRAVGGGGLSATADPVGGALPAFGELEVVRLGPSRRCPGAVMRAAAAAAAAGAAAAAETAAAAGAAAAAGGLTHPGAIATKMCQSDGEVAFWRCSSERAEAQAVAADVERLLAREGVEPGDVVVLVPAVWPQGQAVAAALEERAVPQRLVGKAAFFQRAEIRDLLAWLRLLADPTDAGAVVRALARPPIELRSIDIARCTQIARRRKLDMVSGLAAAMESPQVPPEARERIRTFLKIYRSGVAAIDTARPDLYIHKLIERLGLRRQQLFAAQPDVVERLQALARFGELAAAHVRRSPQATPREFVKQVAVAADFGLREAEEPELTGARAVQVVSLAAAGGLEAAHVYVLGLQAGLDWPAPAAIPAELLSEPPPAENPDTGRPALRELRQALYTAITRARSRVVLSVVGGTPLLAVEEARVALDASWIEQEEELFGPAETLHSTYRLLRDELLEATVRAGGRLGELRFDTDLDVSHAVVRYLELLKLAALIARPEDQSLREGIRDVNARILQAVTSEQREIFESSVLDEYLLDAERDVRRRAQAMAARDEPSLEAFLPRRGEGVVLSASDIDTYRTCPLKYKFARVFRIPQEPSLHQRFGILVHQVLERFHARSGAGGASGGGSRAGAGSLAELLGLLDAGWRRGGFSDSEEERQLRGKAASALTRYHVRFQASGSEPMWFERPFTFKLGPHLLRGRVDRVDRLPGGDYELIDYKTGRPKSPAELLEDVQLSLYAVGAREAWRLESSQQAYYYLLDDEKVALPPSDGEWVREVATEVAEGILSQGFEPTPSISACSICDYRLVCPAAER